MPYGLPWSEEFVGQLADKEMRDEFVADQIRTRIAALIRALREQEERGWTQTELGKRAGKPQNVISRYEDPDYGKMSLQTLLEIAAAFDLPVWIDIPEWEDWFERIKDVPSSKTKRSSFDLEKLAGQARAAKTGALTGSIPNPFQLTESASGAPALKRAANNNFKIQAVATTA
jgi:transcriptional regulator with XRE-family HTH domain